MSLPMESDVASHRTYWQHGGRYQQDYDRLQELLVPSQGEASTEHGEFLRHCGNVYYDVFNNGGCNLDEGRNEDLVEWVKELERYGYTRTAAIRKLFKTYLKDDSDYDIFSRRGTGRGFKRQYPAELEDAVEFTVLKVKEIHERLQQPTPGSAPAPQQAKTKKARHRQ